MSIQVQGLAPLLQVFRMPAAIHFYRDVLGFTVTASSPMLSDDPDDVNWVMLQLNDAVLMLNTAYDPDDTPAERDAQRWSGHQDTALFLGCPDVDAAYEYLRSRAIQLDPPRVAPYGMKQLYLKDPDGFSICFQWPAASAVEATTSAEPGVQVRD